MSKQASTIKHFSLPLLRWPQRCIYHCYYSFREALPGLIGSSWSQNPLCRCSHWNWTCSFLLSQHWVFLPAAWRTVILCKVAMKPAGQMDGGSWTPPAKPGRWQRKRDTWGETLTWLCSHRCGKSSREPRAIRPPSQFHGAIIPSGPHLHFNW